MRKLIKERMENKVVNFVGLNKVVLGIKWMHSILGPKVDTAQTFIHIKYISHHMLIYFRLLLNDKACNGILTFFYF